MLQPNGVLAIPNSHGTTKLVYCPNNSPTATFASEFRVVFDYDLAHFANSVAVGYLGAARCTLSAEPLVFAQITLIKV